MEPAPSPPAKPGLTHTQLRTILGVVGILAGLASLWLPGWIKRRNETQAVAALKVIATAQGLFRENDRRAERAPYATLAQLGQAQLIDAVLAGGTRDGYIFRAAPSSTTPEFLWWATAEPAEPGKTGDRWLFVNHTGLIGDATGPIAVDTRTCESPSGRGR